MMDIFYSPEQPAVMLSSQKLYNDVAIKMAHYEDCYLYISGGTNATNTTMGVNDTFIVGNYDLGLATLTLLDMYAENGNVTDFAACGEFNGCPLMSAVDYTNKTGQVGLRFCVGGDGVAFGAWGLPVTNVGGD